MIDGFDRPIVIHIGIQRRAHVLISGIVYDSVLDQGGKRELTANAEQVHGRTGDPIPTECEVGYVVGAVVQGMKMGGPAIQNRIVGSNRGRC